MLNSSVSLHKLKVHNVEQVHYVAKSCTELWLSKLHQYTAQHIHSVMYKALSHNIIVIVKTMAA
jgi:hypothetical protein